MGRAFADEPYTGNLLLGGLKLLLDALASLCGQALWLHGVVLLALVRSGAQEFQLVSVSAAPFAKEQMQPKPESLEQRKFPIHCLRLKPRRLLAAWGKKHDASSKAY
jgi:hypothetical protein